MALLPLSVGIHWDKPSRIANVEMAIMKQSCVSELLWDICCWGQDIALVGRTGEVRLDGVLMID